MSALGYPQLAPGRQYTPGGRYPPSTGQYPPPGGQYPPSGGQYPPPQMPAQGPGDWMPPPQVSNCPPGLEYLTQIDQLLIKQKVKLLEGNISSFGAMDCPPGLEYLTEIDQLLVKQQVEMLEVITSFETKNKFKIKDSMGQQIYFAKENSSCCNRCCCGPIRPFNMVIKDNAGNEVMNIYRSLACDTCCFPCCLQSVEVSAPPGNIIGVVQQDWSIFTPTFSIKNESEDTLLKIKGPICTCKLCCDVEFKVLGPDGKTEVGKVTKQFSGLVREMFTDGEHFGISFPMDLDVKIKATLLGACFLIDAMYFEEK